MCVITWNGGGGGISRAGNERLQQLLVVGATAIIRFAKLGSKSASARLLTLLKRKPRKILHFQFVFEAAIGEVDRRVVALANKVARIVWAMMATGEAYRDSKTVAAPAAGAAAAG